MLVRKIEVHPYDATWPIQFEREAKQLRTIFGEQLIAIDHIGSTSIPQLCAKPVIDILITVKQINDVDTLNMKMNAFEYVAHGTHGIEGRRFFSKGGDQRTHHVHVFEKGDAQIERHLLFRDYLRAHPEVAKQYGTLKEQLAAQYRMEKELYIAGKHDFIQFIDEKAKRWAQTT